MELATAFSGQRAIITGGLGFIGSHLAKRLLELGAAVTLVDILDPNMGGNWFNIEDIRDKVQVIQADVGDGEVMAGLVHRNRFLFNLAGQTSHLGSMQDPLKDLEINVVNQVRLLEVCRLHNPAIRIVYAGTRQVYGRAKYLPVDERHIPAPIDYNSVSKRAGESYHMACARAHGMEISVLRMTNVYGPHMRVKDARQAFIGWWIRQILNDQPLEIYGNGRQIRDFNYVEDVVDALLVCVIHPSAKGKIYNLGGKPIRLFDLANLLIEINGAGGYVHVPFPEERKRIDIGDYFGNYRLIRKELGWSPRVSLRAGLARTLDFYRRHGEHYR